MNTRPVLVGISHDQPKVLRYALDEARQLGTYVRVAHVITHDEADRFDGVVLAPWHDWVRQAVQSHIDPPRVDYFDWYGEPAEILVVESREACLVVVGGDDLPWITRMTGGEVARKVSLDADCPVIVVPSADQNPERPGGVVLAVDVDRPIEAPLLYAFREASARQETLQVVTSAGETSDRPGRDANRQHLEQIMDDFRAQFRQVQVRPVLDAEHSVAACLLASQHASLLVLGRPLNDHAPWSPLGVAGRVLRRAKSPVVIVPLDRKLTTTGVS